MYIIVFTRIIIVATIIYIVCTKIGSVSKRLKCYNNDIGVDPNRIQHYLGYVERIQFISWGQLIYYCLLFHTHNE